MESPAAARHMKDYALARLSDAGLSLQVVAAAFHCTGRTVQNHFAADGESFSAWLLRERLSHAHALLCEPSQGVRSLKSVAYSCGFASAAHFYRAFKARFGAPPGALRKS
jgi:AraC-like DNA-binding protein